MSDTINYDCNKHPLYLDIGSLKCASCNTPPLICQCNELKKEIRRFKISLTEDKPLTYTTWDKK